MSAAQNSKTPSKPLSAKAIEAMKPNSPIKPDIGENAGLRVKCGSTGLKTFFYRYKSPETGKLTQIKIGNYPDISLAEARVELAKLKELRRSGLCPKAERDQAMHDEAVRKSLQLQKQKEETFTVKELVDLYLAEYIEDRYTGKGDKRRKIAGARKPKGQAEVRRTLYGDAVRVLGEVPANKVTRKMVVDVAMEVVKRGAKVQAGNVVRELSAAYEFSIGLNRFPEEFANPALLAKASLNQAKVKMTHSKGKRVLNDAELNHLQQWLPGSGFSQKHKQILMLTLYTGCRTGEWCEAQWRDIDLTKGIFHIKASKNDAERYVQLSTQAVSLLKLIDREESIYVFPSSQKGKHLQQKSLTEAKWAIRNPEHKSVKRQFTKEQVWPEDMDDWNPHDLRRTVRSGLSRMRCPSEVGEAVLGHSKKGIEGTYDLHRYEDECREWLQKWCDHVYSLTDNDF